MESLTEAYGEGATSALKEAARRLTRKESEAVDRVRESCADAYDEVSTRTVRGGSNLHIYANQAAAVLDKSLKTRPMSTIAGAVALGCLLGAI